MQVKLDIRMQHPDAHQFSSFRFGQQAAGQVILIQRAQQPVHMAQLGNSDSLQRSHCLAGEQQHTQAFHKGTGRLCRNARGGIDHHL